MYLIKDYQIQTEQNIKQLEEACEKERNTWSNSVAQLEELYQVNIIYISNYSKENFIINIQN